VQFSSKAHKIHVKHDFQE